ncbi:MAG: GTPase HflX [Chitinophagales bacterium]|nr:GTPase HflX [Chitinophagales bacterium]
MPKFPTLQDKNQEFKVDNSLDTQEKVVLVAVAKNKKDFEQVSIYLDELEFLAQTAQVSVVDRFIQILEFPDNKTYVGSGKLLEIKEFCTYHNIDAVIFDDEISPGQLRNIEEILKIKVLDRAMIILDIFAQNAKTLQAKTQVELAQTQYMLPRLKGLWTHLDRIKGGIGMRGSGEKEIETDKRLAQTKISKLKEKLDEIAKQNIIQRKSRHELIRVALVGYTNVGKSTLLNLLAKENILAEDKLFATLDTTVRKVVIDNVPFLLSDTVGFIRKLPHQLIESFKSTLAEVLESDILIHVVDASSPHFESQINIVNQTLNELKCQDKPILMVFNKLDKLKKQMFDEFLFEEEKNELLFDFQDNWMKKTNQNSLFISATEMENLQEFRLTLLQKIKSLYAARFPFKAKYLWGYENFES